jgi:hypothetical protein
LGETADCAADLAATVEDFDSGSVGSFAAGLLYFGEVFAFLEHAKGCAEGEVADDVEGEVVEPVGLLV